MKREYGTNEMKPNKRNGALFRLFGFISFVPYSLFILNRFLGFVRQSRWTGRLLIFVSVVLASYFLLPIVLNGAARQLVRNDPLIRADVVVALGGDKRCEREKRAAELYLQGWASKVMVSGVQYVWGVHTGEVGKRYVIGLGVAEDDVLVIRDTWNTRTEAERLAELMRERGWRTAIIVTSSFHSRRALYTTEKAAPDLNFYSSPVAAVSPEWVPDDWWKRRGDAYLTTRELISWTNTLLKGWQ
jgi:uncharacterized SAM-binding protein YcdF (DUF218 family)